MDNTGLKDAQQIGGLAINPKMKILFFAALGHPYGANEERGVYRTTDGGKTWQRVLYKDENTGAVQVGIDPNNPDVVYADMWAGKGHGRMVHGMALKADCIKVLMVEPHGKNSPMVYPQLHKA